MSKNNFIKNPVNYTRNVGNYIFGSGSISNLDSILNKRKKEVDGEIIIFIDKYFKNENKFLKKNTLGKKDILFYVDTEKEPDTVIVNKFSNLILENQNLYPSTVVGIGGGSTMDISKAVSNLLTNPGKAEDYQGWDLLKNPSIYKIGIPTIFGTGSESTRTCVMTNSITGLKLGMNSNYSIFDQIILDPDLTMSVPRNQYFWTGVDTYIHCIESLNGNYRNVISDSYSLQALKLCKDIFHSDDMMDHVNRSKMAVASYLGGCAIASSFLGLIHPLSAGLSVVLGLHHGVANCIVMRAMKEFYNEEYLEFWEMVNRQSVHIPSGVCNLLTEDQYESLYNSTIIHEKPLTNALGSSFKEILTKKKVKEIFKKM